VLCGRRPNKSSVNSISGGATSKSTTVSAQCSLSIRAMHRRLPGDRRPTLQSLTPEIGNRRNSPDGAADAISANVLRRRTVRRSAQAVDAGVIICHPGTRSSDDVGRSVGLSSRFVSTSCFPMIFTETDGVKMYRRHPSVNSQHRRRPIRGYEQPPCLAKQ